MKISSKLLLITFLIVVVVSAASTIIYNSVANRLLYSQLFNSLLSSKNDFAFRFENENKKMNDEFSNQFGGIKKLNSSDYKFKNIDFWLTVNQNSEIDIIKFKKKTPSVKIKSVKTINDFVAKFPNIIFNYKNLPKHQTIYYGRFIDNMLLNKLSKDADIEVAFLIGNKPLQISNKNKNEKLNSEISESAKFISEGNLESIYNKELSEEDFFSTIYTPKNILTPVDNSKFLLFKTSVEAQNFTSTMNIFIVVLIISGISLALVLVLLFTTGFRKQLGLLTKGVEIIGGGNIDHRVNIITNDEIGKLGLAFNQMLDELKNKESQQKDYSELITLINENPTLAEISEAALKKIINSTNLLYGILYQVKESKKLRLLANHGIDTQNLSNAEEIDLYIDVIKNQSAKEHRFFENHPVIKTGAAEIKVSYLTIFPIIYNKQVIGILELGAHSTPLVNVQEYLKNINEQLAVGITNAAAFEQAEILVDELKELNQNYQNQNEQITEQNEKLLALHQEITANAEELEKEREKALESARVKSQFLATMSHELRTPLNSILGLSELVLNEKGILDKTKDRNGIILRNGRRLLNIINNILEFSKLDFGKIEIESAPIKLQELLKQISSSVEPLFTEKNLNFTIEYPTNVDITVNSDKNKIEHILLNLITNAIKFTENGSVKLRFSIKENNTAEFSVIDSGIGIDDQNLKMIFEEFRQIDSGNARKYGGAGLGLAICKRYSELLGGKLSVVSEVNKGSNFSFILPDAVTTNTIVDENVESEIIINNEVVQSRKDILLICRDITTNKTLQKYLDSDEYNATVCTSGKDGIEEAKKNTPDLISIDLDIKDMSGWEVLMQLKNTKTTADIPVIVASIFEEEDLCYELDVFDFIFKNTGNERIQTIVSNIESFENSKIKNVLTVDYGDGALEQLRNVLTDCSIKNIFVEDEIFKTILDDKPDLLIVNLIAPSFDELYFLNTLKLNSQTRRIPVVVSISQNLSESEITRINSTIKNLTKKAQHHPLDILKLIRKRLNMDQEWPQSVENSNSIALTESSLKHYNQKETILIVDDDEDTLFTVSEIVCNLGYKTLTARNGVECLLAIDKAKPDLVLLDIMMPKMDGFETIKRIRNDKSLTGLPVVAMTAHAMLDDVEIIEKNGFDDILTKPVDTSAIAIKVENSLVKTEIKS